MAVDLSHLKVVELASVLAGPAVGMFFAERGAKVIKIENKNTRGDVTRSWKLPEEDDQSPVSAYFSSVNWHKEHLFLDLKEASDLNYVKQIIQEADIFISNFKVGDAQKFGLAYEDVKQLNPTIIHGEITGFGPDNNRVAYDLVLQAETGFMFMNGTDESGPVKMPLAMIDVLAAHQLKEGILEALLQRSLNDKQAYHVEVSLYDAAICSLYNQGANYLMAGHVPQRMGSLHPNIAPYGETFTTKDQKLITLAIGSDKQFESLCEILGVSVDSIFDSNQKRVENRAKLFDKLSGLIAQWSIEDIYSKLIENHVPVAKINNLEEVFKDKNAQSLILNENVDGTKTKRIKTVAYRITED